MKGLKNDETLASGESVYLSCFVGGVCGGFLEKNVFASIESLDCPLEMETVGKGVVDGVNEGVV